MKIDKCFQNHGSVVGTTENEAPWILVTHKSRTLLQPSPSSITTENRYEALTTTETQCLQEEAIPAAHNSYRKKKRQVLTVGDSLLRGIESPIC